jgi:AcrR family transcriptional regulator
MTTRASAPVPKSSPASTRDRLLDAAAEVFARDGLAAATTREIARVAGVNEVTLFRLFTNKQNLIAAVLERVFALPAGQNAAAADQPASAARIIQEYAENYHARLSKNFALVRVMIAEIQHHEEHERKVMSGIFRPERQRLVERLRAAQEAGAIRPEVDLYIVADQVGAFVFMGILRTACQKKLEYSAKSYFQAGIETIVRAIEIPAKSKTETTR